MVCQFGWPIRGLSPYGDALLKALQCNDQYRVIPVDYFAAYPALLHPGGTQDRPSKGLIHWANPISWYNVARMPAEIIHFQHWMSPMAFYLAPIACLAKNTGKKVIITVHNPEPHESITSFEFIDNLFLKLADRLIIHDKRGEETLKARIPYSSNTVCIIPHGISVLEKPESASFKDYSLLGLDPGRRYVCIFGNLRGYKGIDTLLKAWRYVVDHFDDVDLIIAGRLWSGKSRTSKFIARLLGTKKQEDHLIESLALPALSGRIHLYEGFQSDEKLDALIRLSEFAVFPYAHFSSQSGAACRAAGMGCPILVSNVGGLPDLVINQDWLVNPGDINDLGKKMGALLDNKHALLLARDHQIQRIASLSWSNIALQHVELYQEVVS